MLFLVLLPLLALAEENEVQAVADRPGAGTGAHVLDWGHIQWETGFEVAHWMGMHVLNMPTTLFRFGLGPWAELRLEYTGLLAINDKPDTIASTPDEVFYSVQPLNVGTKIRLWGGSDDPKLRWIPRTSLMFNLGLPLTSSLASYIPVTGTVDFLFENDVTDWFSVGYDVGVYWIDPAPTPDIFVSLGFNFAPTDKLGLFVESHNSFDPDARSLDEPAKTYTVCSINLDFGLTYMVHPLVQLDLYSGFNLYHSGSELSGPQNDVMVGLGVTWLLYHPSK